MAVALSPAASTTTIACSSAPPTASAATAAKILLKASVETPILQSPCSLVVQGPPPRPLPCRRAALSACLAALTLPLAGVGPSRAAILEADDDEELLERVKQDRKKRIERQGAISSSGEERVWGNHLRSAPWLYPLTTLAMRSFSYASTGNLGGPSHASLSRIYLQEVIYKLSKVGQAIENNDLPAASSVLGSSTKADWLQKVNTAFTKLSSTTEQKTEVDEFNTNLKSLFASVSKRDLESAKLAFVSSASALEKWVELTGFVGQLKGL